MLLSIGTVCLAEAVVAWIQPEWETLQLPHRLMLSAELGLLLLAKVRCRTLLGVGIAVTAGVIGAQKLVELIDLGIILSLVGLGIKYAVGVIGFAVLTGFINEYLRLLTISRKQANTEAELEQMAANSLSTLFIIVLFLFLGKSVLWILELYWSEAPWLLYKWLDGLVAYVCACLKQKEASTPAVFVSMVICGFISIQAVKEAAYYLSS